MKAAEDRLTTPLVAPMGALSQPGHYCTVLYSAVLHHDSDPRKYLQVATL
jgi:hypothetical protein